MIIDAHQHFWRYDASRYGWIGDDMQKLKRDFMPPDLKKELDTAGVNGCIAVQAIQTEKETEFLLSLFEKYTFIKGVVGWLDLQSPDIEQRLQRFSRFDALKGMRHVVQDEPDDNFLLRSDFKRGIQQLAAYDLCYDILILERQLPVAVQFVGQFPDQPFILNHMAKPDIKEQTIAFWKNHIQALAKFPNMYCKVSGMITEADWDQWQPEDFKPYLDIIFESFGPDRIMFGSDWPVCTLAGSYQDVYEIITQYVSKLSKTEQKKVMGENAKRIYTL